MLTHIVKNRLAPTLIALWAVFLPLSLVGQDEMPAYLAFESMAVKGEVQFPLERRQGLNGLNFDARFQLHPEGDGIMPGDDFQIATALIYPAALPQLAMSELQSAFAQLTMRTTVHGECFEQQGQSVLFELTEKNLGPCVDVSIEFSRLGPVDAAAAASFPLNQIVRHLSVRLTPLGRPYKENGAVKFSRWKMRSEVVFQDPGFPFPVAGFGGIPGFGPSGTTITIGDDSGTALFSEVAFEGGYSGPVGE